MAASDKIPDYLTGSHQLASTVVFTTLFSLVFILLISPYLRFVWFTLGLASKTSLLTIVFMSLVIVILALSKMTMYAVARKHTLIFFDYVMWCLGEAVLISLAYAAFSINGIAAGVISHPEDITFLKIFISAMGFCLISLGVPYLLSAFFFAIEDKNNTIRLMSFGAITTDEAPSLTRDEKITLFDNSGALKLVVSLSNLYYIEADDNYIKVWYQDSEGTLKQYMLRCRLKTVEESFTGSVLVRCHRKYIVNFDKVEMISRTKDGFAIELGLGGIEPIPVSKTYEDNVLARFNSRGE
ncbi:MAG: LytTR family transcriptional regulator [Bacteroidales bacterium]|nr:LytTR family transcriptional regulator [Bacteroidales bacterium]